MSSPYSSITDGTTTIDFIGNPDFKPFIHTPGAVYNPLGNQFPTLTVDIAKTGITATMVAIPSSQANDFALWQMLMEGVELEITFPDGTTMVVGVDPTTDPVGEIQYSTWLWQFVNTWTVKFWQVA